MSRKPWDARFPDVFIQTLWKTHKPKTPSLAGHPQYNAAKGQRDMGAAIDIVGDLATRQTVLNLCDFVEAQGGTPILIAPSTLPGNSNNALAIGYAQWLSHELDWPVEERVFHNKNRSRDASGVWPRIAHRCEFRGEIDTKGSYVIVDDVMTLGGTMADLRSFILSKGGRVIAMSAIASRNGRSQPIRLANGTYARISKTYGNDLSNVGKLLGFDCTCLTEAEGQTIANCSNFDHLRKKIAGARHS